MTASKSELEILAKLIEKGPAKATELHKHFQKKWGAATVLTFLQRLRTKGLVEVTKKEGTRAHIFSPTKKGQKQGLKELKNVVRLFYGGRNDHAINDLESKND